ncbi:MAG: hypothetical protein WCV62_02225 [Candidatus Peribacteraceae bacterium]
MQEQSLSNPASEHLAISEGVIAVEIWELVSLLTGTSQCAEPEARRLLVRYVFGGEVKSYRELHALGLNDFPFNRFMYSSEEPHLGTPKGWLPLSPGDVVVPCYQGDVPPVRLKACGSL